MKKYKKTLKQQKQAERDTTLGKPTNKPADRKQWIKQFRWKSEKDFNNYPKWMFDKTPYSPEWKKEWGRYGSAQGVEDSIKKDLRNRFTKRYVEGRLWRAYNEIDGTIVEFPNIETYYQ